jgi:hypothetical protein
MTFAAAWIEALLLLRTVSVELIWRLGVVGQQQHNSEPHADGK